MGKPMLDIIVGQDEGVTHVVLIGPVDSATHDTFRDRLDPVCNRPAARVLLDCRELSYLNSRAIGLLVKYHRVLMMSRGRLAMCSVNPKLVRTLELLQLGKSLNIYPTREEALAALR